jgi:glycosyltransferase involved in cell wall biosynthesis
VKICLLTKRFYTGKDLIEDRYGRLYHLPKSWSERGADVDVVALDYRTQSAEQIKEGRLTLRSFPSNGLSLGDAKQLIEWDDYDVLIVSGHLNLARMALSIAKKHRLPCIFDLYDYYPAFLGTFHSVGAVYMRHLLRSFDGAMVVSRALEEWCRSSNKAICRIPNGVDAEVFRRVSQAEARQALSIDANVPVFGLFGSLSKDLGGREVLAAFAKFRERHPNAQLLVGGAGSSSVEGVLGARSLGMLKQVDLSRWASACDCLLIPYRDSLQVRYSQSARMAEYLAIKKPIVVTRTGDAQSWFPADYSGWCDPSDSDSMCRAMVAQIERPELVPFPDLLQWQRLGEKSYDWIKSFCP